MDDTPREESPPPALPLPPPSGAPPPSRVQRREGAVRDALRTLVRDCFSHAFGAGQAPSEPVELTLSMQIRPGENWALTFDPPLEEQVAAQLEDSEAGRGVFLPGRVHCFRCRSSACEHSQPPSPLCVFRGYGATGVPEWCELVQAFIETRDERVDRLYADPPALLAAMQLGSTLRLNQLSPFGRSSKTYAVLAQTVAGYFTPPEGCRVARPVPERFAVTVQAVETRDREGVLALRLNTIVGGLDPDTWEELLVCDAMEPVARVLRQAEHAAAELESLARAARAERSAAKLRLVLGRVPRLLLRLARDLERTRRQSYRRTRHAQEHRRPERPVHKALDDVRAAHDDELFYDEKRNTWIACGRQGRTHAFSLDGRHVTSFILPPGGAEFRVRTSRWRRLQPQEIQQFRRQVGGAGAATP